ncbi:MAG: hypothetical protein KBG80_06320 [Breznakibacter sp.]|jgi:hypothetical protein|nr:hypothetical protein [Breznakibacter sp.]
MITVAQAVESVIQVKPFLVESLAEGIVNVSCLARKIQPQVEALTMRKVKQGAIVMAVNRFVPQLDVSLNRNLKKLVENLGDIIVRSDLTDYTFKNSTTLVNGHSKVLKIVSEHPDVFYTFVRGVFESNLVVSSSYVKIVDTHFASEECLFKGSNLSAITIKLPTANTTVSGFYYYILKAIAWEGINIREVISTTNEFSIIINDEDVDRAFAVLKHLKKSPNMM